MEEEGRRGLDRPLWPTLRGLRNAEGEDAKAAALEQVMEVIMPLEDAFAKCGKGKASFGGDTIGYLDIAFGCFLGWLRVTEKLTDIKILDVSKTPGLFGWAQGCYSGNREACGAYQDVSCQS
ncbi:hypothetical protein RHSIM_Rhsim12G0054000 [Rhododendron simsii]|uniref:GST C-terminal domain-containing protein n=1 Tax=Rhododendron simsii TaxID=118357 RepID=A0A834L9M8_RHOSS|nr:hypothetical protein RHSIM_Rhsim12G0054000 [Rhododendron simsii]